MTRRRITHHRPADGPDPIVTEALREAHAPPATPGYWDGLEGRIMAHVRTARDGATRCRAGDGAGARVVAVMAAGRAGRAAAGVAAIVAAAARFNSRAEERPSRYAAVLEATTVAPAPRRRARNARHRRGAGPARTGGGAPPLLHPLVTPGCNARRTSRYSSSSAFSVLVATPRLAQQATCATGGARGTALQRAQFTRRSAQRGAARRRDSIIDQRNARTNACRPRRQQLDA